MTEERRRDYPAILDKLEAIHASQIRMEERLAGHQLRLDAYHSMLYGNGKSGLSTDVDRLKQTATFSGWLLGTVWVALLGMVVKVFTGK